MHRRLRETSGSASLYARGPRCQYRIDQSNQRSITGAGIRYEIREDIELSPAEDADIRRRIEEAETDLPETRVRFRWSKGQLDLVKRAARIVSIPYHTYLKDIVYNKAIDDVARAQHLQVPSGLTIERASRSPQ